MKVYRKRLNHIWIIVEIVFTLYATFCSVKYFVIFFPFECLTVICVFLDNKSTIIFKGIYESYGLFSYG